MSKLAAKLNKRVEIRVPVRTPSTGGALAQTYETIAEVWASIKPITMSYYAQAVYSENKQTNQTPTHIMLVRCAKDLGIIAHGTEGHMKVGNYVFLPTENNAGRSFRIHSVQDVDERGEYLKVQIEEVEYQPDAESLTV